jgi:hypothetical protein
VTTLTDARTVRTQTEIDGNGGLEVTELMGGGRAQVNGAVRTPSGAMMVTSELTRTHFRRALFRTVLDAGPARARMRVDGARDPLRICAHIPASAPAGAGRTSLAIDGESSFGRGWSRPERSDGGQIRRARSPATILLALPADRGYRISIDAAAAAGLWFTLEMNGVAVGECEFRGWKPCVVDVVPGQRRPGVSALTIRLSRPVTDESGVSLTLRGVDYEAR